MTLTTIQIRNPNLVWREPLRQALEHRHTELRAALRLYEEVAVSNAPRVALIGRTRQAMHDIEVALRHLHDVDYGTCRFCHRRLRTSTLTLSPLASRCANCMPLDAA